MNTEIFNDNQQYFLATTALEDFWDTTKPIVFLGDWCLRYSRKSFWNSLNWELLPSQGTYFDKFDETTKYVNNLYEYLLPIFATKLNSIHNEKLSTQAWRIIIGHWLNCCIFTLYDRYQVIRCALNMYPNITTIGLSKESYVIPKNTSHFLSLSMNDLYNLQLFTQILIEQGIDFPKKNTDKDFIQKDYYAYSRYRGLLKEFLISLFRFSQNLFNKSSPIVLNDSFFPLPVVMKIFMKTRGRVTDLNLNLDYNLNYTVDDAIRGGFQNLFPPKNNFEQLFSLMIPTLIPSSFVENYAYIKEITQKRYPRNTKAIFSSVSWSGNEEFKIWAAHMSEKGTKLFGAQHGGNYGSEHYLFFENHEVSITDRYYTWGWSKDNCRSKVIPSFANKLVERQKFGFNRNEDSILLLTLATARYANRFASESFHFSEYFNYQFRFVAALGDDFRRKLRVRLFFDDFGWDCKERWNGTYPDVSLEGWDVKFADSIKQSRICINDNLSTTFLETLSWDKPTILFWGNNVFPLRDEAKPFYDELRATGILFDVPEEAALALRNIYGDVESWWHESHRQKAVQKFCEHFARTSPKALKYWTEEFNKLAKELKN